MVNKIPLGFWIQHCVSFLTERFETEFRQISEGLGAGMNGAVQVGVWIPPYVWMGGLACLAYVLSRSWKNSVLTFLGIYLIWNLGYWQETLETVSLVTFSTAISAGVGIPIGILCARKPGLYKWVQPLLDLMQTIPTFVYLIPTLMLFGLGMAPGLISTVIFAMPAPIRFTYLGLSGVPSSLLEVGEAFGATKWQRLFQIEIPYALPTIRAGLSQCVMLSLSMVVIAALVGADGLGKPVVQALNTVNIAKGFESGMVIVILAILIDRLLVMKRSYE